MRSTAQLVKKWGKENAHVAYSDRADRDPDHRRPHGAGDRDRERQNRHKPQRGDADAVERSVAVTVFGLSALSRSWRFGSRWRAARLHARAVAHRDAGRLKSGLTAATRARMLVE